MDYKYLIGNLLAKYTPLRLWLWLSPKHTFKFGKCTWQYATAHKYMLCAHYYGEV